MSTDEQATIIGRMILERNDLVKQGALLNEELTRIGTALSALGDQLRTHALPYTQNVFELTSEHQALLDQQKIGRLLTEAARVTERYKNLKENLERAGV